ncbi:hypothetical protein A7U60_g1178 [Sanghuangporus baumii]|uniref:Uncharacterized protein n=1 Tax=Sanghuangporus baumii TaxID=108892 RepID=A0A9Q5I5K8_SANBA|nr:hypothetical protein A7U60_g1178 [Sanghuangporus baumii]
MSSSIQPSDSDSPPRIQPPTPTKATYGQRSLSPLVGLLAFSTVLITACTLPPYLLLRTRLARVDGTLSDVFHVAQRAKASQYTEGQVLEAVREVRRVREETEVLRGQADKIASDVRDVRSVLLKERVRLASIEGRFDGLREQLKSQEQRVLTALAAEQKRYSKTENEINELRKTADQNADNLSKVAVSLADIATLIHQTELEHGIPPERGKESSKREQLYDFKYEDEDTVMNEIDEFFSYVEAPQIGENLKAWEGSFPGEWIKAPYRKRLAHVNLLLESLEHKDAVIRFTNARRLFYVVQGTFAETSSPEHQLHWIIENCKTVRAADGISIVAEAVKIANSKHDLLSSLSDADVFRLNISAQDKQDCIEEVNTELSVYFGIMYFLVEVLKDSDDFAEELMSLEPPLPVYLFNVVAGLRDKSFKGYPVKKLLLLLWKTILACCGGSRDLLRVKKLVRESSGLPEEKDEPIPIKSSPFDLQTFRQETSVKFPTFTATPDLPPPSRLPEASVSRLSSERRSGLSVSPLKLAEAFSPIPVRHHYHHSDDPDFQQQQSNQGQQQQNQAVFPTGNPTYNPTAQPLTPMPTPPPSPKPKKQQYQTDQSRPFLFPFSRSQVRGSRGARLVPDAIEEADRLYNKHMHISVSLYQMWRTREDCMIEESGLHRLTGAENLFETFDSVLSLNSHGVDGSSATSSALTSADKKSADDAEDATEQLPDVALLNTKIAETETAIKQSEGNIGGSWVEVKKLKELRQRREDLQKLKRVEHIYAAVLPNLQGWVLVLLKMLLATVSVNSLNQPPPSASSNAFPPGVGSPAEQQQPPPPPLTADEIDLIRHREIMSKAVSAILLLTLRWFKASHAMKFHYLGQLLLESNCLLLILKMFTFFQYCLRYSKNPPAQRPEDNMVGQPRQSTTRTIHKGTDKEEEIELITEFSWRNFFSSINFVRIMQKLSKHRSHRIWLLVQYKSSAVLKRITKVSHPMLQLYVLKLIKSQVPYCGRKWRQSNMKCITTIYLNCRPDLRDEWLTGSEVDDAQDALAQEQALRKLVKFYNNKRYGSATTHAMARDNHRRSSSLSMPLGELHAGPELSAMARPVGTPNMVEADVFPPLRAQAPDPSIFLPYTTEDIAFEEEYEEYLSDLGMGDDYSWSSSNDGLFGGTSAWHRLPHMGTEIADGISDSESIASIGELGDEAKFDPGSDSDREDENRNNWEHMSPKTMAALPKSPVGPHRRSSSGSSLRPVIPFGLDDNSAVDLEEAEDDEGEMGPMPREQDGPFAQGGGVDEVEYAYGL